MSKKTYDVLKAVAQIWLPALGTLIFTVTDIWSLEWGPQVVGTVMAADTFLGVILGVSTKTWNRSGSGFDGDLVVDRSDPAKDSYSLNLTTPLDRLPDKSNIVLRVTTPESS